MKLRFNNNLQKAILHAVIKSGRANKVYADDESSTKYATI